LKVVHQFLEMDSFRICHCLQLCIHCKWQ